MSGFDLAFEEEVLSTCLRDTEYLKSAVRLLDAHHFSSPEHAWVWRTVREMWVKFTERTTPKLIKAKAAHDFLDEEKYRIHLSLAAKLFKLKVATPRASLEELRGFVRFARLQGAMEEGFKAFEKGSVDKAYDAVRKAVLDDIRPTAFTVVKWGNEFEERMRERKHRREHPEEYLRIPTGIPQLDEILGGGQLGGEVALVIGTTGKGKSIFLTHIGYMALIHDYYGVHFSLEMKAEQVATRYDSRFTKMLHRKFKGFDFTPDELRHMNERYERLKDRINDRLHIVSIPLGRCDISSVRDALDQARVVMPKLDFCIVDSGDHMKGLGRFESFRLEQAAVYRDLKTLAEEQNLVLWSSTHAGREWAEKTATAEASSESYDKTRIADLVVSLNQPKAEKLKVKKVIDEEGKAEIDEEKGKRPSYMLSGELLELFVAKYRDGESKKKIPLDAEFQRMLIKEAKEEEDE